MKFSSPFVKLWVREKGLILQHHLALMRGVTERLEGRRQPRPQRTHHRQPAHRIVAIGPRLGVDEIGRDVRQALRLRDRGDIA